MGLTKRRQAAFTVIGLCLLAVMLFPVYWMLNASLQSGSSGAGSTLLPLHPTLAAYRLALSQQGGNILTSLVISCGTVVLSLVIAAPAAYVLAKTAIRGRSVILFALVVTQMIPGIVIANSLYPVFNQVGLLDTRVGLVLADTSTALPFAILIMRAFMASLPGEIIEAARVDGAGFVRTFVSIVLPISRNAVITAALFSFLFSWSDFLFALTLTTGSSLRPVTLGIYDYLGDNVQAWGPVMATGVLSALPAIVLLAFAQRFIAVGQLDGAVK
ncbi:carbohydrate ABC transporter permease [Streptacidiphilus sp. PB12-B1b]|uniref:carbohydrate ABC transporter permease n=1 Tax=Streptacidiphilus TaxID=228398 RepID=UPI00054B5796|nr:MULTISPECIES: carbohydrate ABC transporter permease [Streptacidiphilus]QMU78419.1 carbohydrate ABC transporter permease [Streptacidiphilus sp. PB12-B1b]